MYVRIKYYANRRLALKMMKKIIAVLLVALMIVSMAACSDKNKEKETEEELVKIICHGTKKEFEENGGDPESFVAPKDDFEIKFKELMSTSLNTASIFCCTF